jgi:hypothetical protein
MVSCWAQALGDCSGGQSREHYLSRSVIGTGEIVVSGFPFLRGQTRTIPGERLVAKILCKDHNRQLSPVDRAAGHLFQVLKAFKERGRMRARGFRKPGGIDMYEVDGTLIERWMLKTLINFVLDRDFAPEQHWRPPELWVRCAFGLTAFPDRCGLYLLADNKWRKPSREPAIWLQPLLSGPNNDVLDGGQMMMADVQFAIAMSPLGRVHQPLFRVRAIKDKPALELRQVINFHWA